MLMELVTISGECRTRRWPRRRRTRDNTEEEFVEFEERRSAMAGSSNEEEREPPERAEWGRSRISGAIGIEENNGILVLN